MVTPTQFHRYDLDRILPIVARRVLASDFASKLEIARSYGIHKDTVKHWRRRAVEMNLITDIDWQRGLLTGRLARLGQTNTTLAVA